MATLAPRDDLTEAGKFQDRWETIGARTSASLFEELKNDRPQFSATGASQRLLSLGRRLNEGPPQVLESSRKLETGSALRLLRWSRSETEVRQMPSKVGDVFRGLEELRASRLTELSPIERRKAAPLRSWESDWPVPVVRKTKKQVAFLASEENSREDVPEWQTSAPKKVQEVEAPMDFFEANAFGSVVLHEGGAEEYERKRQEALARIAEQDPPVHQFLEFIIASYKTLRLAFRQMDSNHNGSLTKSEFVDSMKTLRTNKGLRQFKEHVNALFSDICECAGLARDSAHVTVAGIRAALFSATSTDALLGRLAGFLVKGDRAHRDSKMPSDADVDHCIQETLHRKDRDTVSKEEFYQALARRRYDDWHFNDLFNRMDKDGSGQLGIREFTARLEPAGAAPRRQQKQHEMLGTEERKRQIEGGHTSPKSSTRLQQMGRRKQMDLSSPQALSPTKAAPFEGATKAGCGWEMSVGGSLEFKRPDYLGLVRQGLSHRRLDKSCSELSLTGRVSVDIILGQRPAPNLVPAPSAALGLHDFDETFERSRMDAV